MYYDQVYEFPRKISATIIITVLLWFVESHMTNSFMMNKWNPILLNFLRVSIGYFSVGNLLS